MLLQECHLGPATFQEFMNVVVEGLELFYINGERARPLSFQLD